MEQRRDDIAWSHTSKVLTVLTRRGFGRLPTADGVRLLRGTRIGAHALIVKTDAMSAGSGISIGVAGERRERTSTTGELTWYCPCRLRPYYLFYRCLRLLLLLPACVFP